MNLLDYLPGDFLTRIGLPEASYPAFGSPAKQLVPADPQRVFLAFINTSLGAVQISTDPGVNGSGPTNQPGINLSTGAQPQIFTYWIHGPIVCAEWWGWQSVPGVVGVITQSLLASAQDGNGVPFIIHKTSPTPPVRKHTGRLASWWASLIGGRK